MVHWPIFSEKPRVGVALAWCILRLHGVFSLLITDDLGEANSVKYGKSLLIFNRGSII